MTEDDFNKNCKAEWDAVAAMLKRSTEQRLEVEVVQAFGNYMASGNSMLQSVSDAVHDWDV